MSSGYPTEVILSEFSSVDVSRFLMSIFKVSINDLRSLAGQSPREVPEKGSKIEVSIICLLHAYDVAQKWDHS